MTLSISTRWEHTHLNPTESRTHLVVTIAATGTSTTRRAPLDLAFALDRSGSMSGSDKLELVKQAVSAAVDQLQETDRVALVVFDDRIDTLHDLTPLDTDHRRHLEKAIASIQARGMTDLAGGWMQANRQLQHGNDNHRIRRTLLLTDGLANQGVTDHGQLTTMTTKARTGGITTSAIGVGYGFDEMLLSGMAEAGGGNFQYIAHASELEAFFSEEIRGLGEMVAQDPFLDISLPLGMKAELINAFPHDQHRNRASVDLRNLSAGEELHLVFAVSARHLREEQVTPELHLHWTVPGTGTIEELDVPATSIPVLPGAPARNDDAAVIVAMERAARDHREAIRLDREGRYEESRKRFFDAAQVLQDAPETDASREVRRDSMRLAQTTMAPLDEHERKRTVHAAHARSRGRFTREQEHNV